MIAENNYVELEQRSVWYDVLVCVRDRKGKGLNWGYIQQAGLLWGIIVPETWGSMVLVPYEYKKYVSVCIRCFCCVRW